MKPYIFSLLALSLTSNIQGQSKPNALNEMGDSIVRIEMYLSAYGVKSDHFPYINVFIDFINDSSICIKKYYNPAYKDSTYSLSGIEMDSILALFANIDLKEIDKEFTVNRTDQPTSTLNIHTVKTTYKIEDYGLEGDYPLQSLYKIVYKY